MSQSPHDALFKGIFQNPNHASPVLRTALPTELVRHLDFRTLRLEDGTFIDENLRSQFSDLLFSIALGGRSARLYLLYEHQSRESPLMAYRLLRYMLAIWEQYLCDHPNASSLPAIIPVVLHHGEDGWTAPTSMQALYDLPAHLRDPFAPFLPNFEFILDDLTTQSDDHLRKRASDGPISAIPTLVLWLFKHARSRAFEDSDQVIAAIRDQVADLLRQALRTPAGARPLNMLIHYTLEVTGVEPEALGQTLTADIDPQFSEVIMTGAEKLRQQGREQGLAQGLAQGRAEALARLRGIVGKLLQLRFGSLSSAAQARLEHADMTDLEQISERVLTADSLAKALSLQ